MKFVFPLPHMVRLKATMQPWEPAVTGPDQTRMAKFADRWGYDVIAIPEHLVMPAEHVELSGPHYLHSTAAQAHIAGGLLHLALAPGQLFPGQGDQFRIRRDIRLAENVGIELEVFAQPAFLLALVTEELRDGEPFDGLLVIALVRGNHARIDRPSLQ